MINHVFNNNETLSDMLIHFLFICNLNESCNFFFWFVLFCNIYTACGGLKIDRIIYFDEIDPESHEYNDTRCLFNVVCNEYE